LLFEEIVPEKEMLGAKSSPLRGYLGCLRAIQEPKLKDYKRNLSFALQSNGLLNAKSMPMHRFRSEGPTLYNRYQFGYCEWMESTTGQDLQEAYENGYLPYSADLSDPRHLFYMARSLRVDLKEFHLDKKRRYDHRKWQSFNLVRECLPTERFFQNYGNEPLELAHTWMKQRFAEAYLSKERLDFILKKPFLKDTLLWRDGSALQAFALIVREDWGAHYWFVFYNSNPDKACAPGQGYLVDFLDWAAGENLGRAYLGTAYGNKSLYKSRGIQGIEFWDGNSWSSDRGKLLRFQEADRMASQSN
jgi:arginine-tRNA-protein transferase